MNPGGAPITRGIVFVACSTGSIVNRHMQIVAGAGAISCVTDPMTVAGIWSTKIVLAIWISKVAADAGSAICCHENIITGAVTPD